MTKHSRGSKSSDASLVNHSPAARNRASSANSIAERRKQGSRVKFGTSDFKFVPVASVTPDPASTMPNSRSTRNRPADAAPPEQSGVDHAQQQLHSPPPPPPSNTTKTETEGVHFSEDNTVVFNDDWNDYRQVMAALFSLPASAKEGRSAAESETALHDAMRVLRLWESRARHRLREQPAYVIATRALVEAQLHDRFAQSSLASTAQLPTAVASLHEPPETTAAVVVAVYCHALSRAVHLMTGITQKQQRHGEGLQSTYRSRAQASGFPEEAVEVRTRIAHGAQPPLSELRWVTSLVLEHLYQSYWVVQRSHIEALVAETKSRRGEGRRQQQQPEPRDRTKRQRSPAKGNNSASFSIASLENLLGAADASLRESIMERRERDEGASVATQNETTALIPGVRLRSSEGAWSLSGTTS